MLVSHIGVRIIINNSNDLERTGLTILRIIKYSATNNKI